MIWSDFNLITQSKKKDPDLTVTDQIRQYLEERGKTCLLCDNSEKGKNTIIRIRRRSVRYRRHSGARW